MRSKRLPRVTRIVASVLKVPNYETLPNDGTLPTSVTVAESLVVGRLFFSRVVSDWQIADFKPLTARNYFGQGRLTANAMTRPFGHSSDTLDFGNLELRATSARRHTG